MGQKSAPSELTTGKGEGGASERGAPGGIVTQTGADEGGFVGVHPEPHEPVFVGSRRAELDELLTRYPTKMAALLPALWMVQEDRGWVSPAAMAEMAELLDLTPAYVKGVVTFYTMYHQHPVGRHFVQVCTTSPCNVCGAEDVVKAFLEHTGCGELGMTSPDGEYTVIEVECLGACGFATPVMINERFVESVTADKVPAILSELR
jgi:NADH-quinone oxidoreductase E subunit